MSLSDVLYATGRVRDKTRQPQPSKTFDQSNIRNPNNHTNTSMDDLFYKIALSEIPGLGAKGCRKLLDLCPDPKTLFTLSKADLTELFGKHQNIIEHVLQRTMFKQAENEIEFINRNQIKVLFMTDEQYPQRLNKPDCEDAPILLYTLGDCDLNKKHVVSIVGTRRATDYGKTMTNRIIEQFSGEDIMVVSGLAYGIDTEAHKSSVNHNVPTVGVLGHGLNQIYPSSNRNLAHQMIQSGGALVTEFNSTTKISPSHFPARNRIIAALSDATIVVEASEKGGAIITANIAHGYHRDVFAVPGKVTDTYSKGCNNLISQNKAVLLQSAEDLYYEMGWEGFSKKKSTQQELFPQLTPDEQMIIQILNEEEQTIDGIAKKSNLSQPKIATALLSLEIKNLIRCLPGRLYKTI